MSTNELSIYVGYDGLWNNTNQEIVLVSIYFLQGGSKCLGWRRHGKLNVVQTHNATYHMKGNPARYFWKLLEYAGQLKLLDSW